MKKFLSFLALLVTAVTAAMAQTYTDVSVVKANRNTSTTENTQVEITDRGDGTCDLVYKQLNLLSQVTFDLTFSGVNQTVGSDGKVTYSFSGNATLTNGAGPLSDYALTEGGDIAISSFTGESKDGKLHLVYDFAMYYGMVTVNVEYGSEITSGPTGTETSYTDNLAITWEDNSGSQANVPAKLVDYGNGTYDIVFNSVYFVTGTYLDEVGKLTISGVTGTTDANGLTTFNYSGTARFSDMVTPGYSYYHLSESGQDVNVTLTGQSKDGKLYVNISSLTYDTYTATLVYGTRISGGDEPTPNPNVNVIASGLQPNGEKFEYTTPIDWNTQKVRAVFTLNGGMTSNENILSVGSQIGTWSQGTHIHMYYNYGTMKANYLTGGENLTRLSDDGYASGRMVVEISKADGLTINGVRKNFTNNNDTSNGDPIGDPTSYYADLWNLAEITLGSQEGNGRCYQTIDTLAIVNLAQEPVVTPGDTTSYAGQATPTWAGTTEAAEAKTVKVVQEANGTTTIVFEQLSNGNTALADYTAKNVMVGSAGDGVTTYMFDGNATVTRVNGDAAYLFNGFEENGTQPLKIVAMLQDGKLSGTFTTTLTGDMGGSELVVEFTQEAPQPTVTPLDAFVQNAADGRFLGVDAYNVTLTKADAASKAHFYAEDGSLYLKVDPYGNGVYSNRDLHLGGSGFSVGTRSALTLYEVTDPNATGTLNLTAATQPELGKTYVITADHNGVQALSNGQTNVGVEDEQRITPVAVTVTDGTLTMTADKTLFWTLADTAADPEEPVVPRDTLSFTDRVLSKRNGYYYSYDENTVKMVAENDEATSYTIIVPAMAVMGQTYGDVTFKGVSLAADGTLSTENKPTISNLQDFGKGSFTEGEELNVTLNGTYKDNALYIDAVYDRYSTYTETTNQYEFVFGKKTEEQPQPAVTVIPENYQPNGSAFSYETDINWDTQYLKLVVDLRNCTGENENTVSVGANIADWNNGPHYHLYYTPRTASLGYMQYNFLTQSGSNLARKDEMLDVSDGQTVIEISKEKGLVMNGTACNRNYDNTEDLDPATAFAELWAMNHIYVGSQQGDTRSNAIYVSAQVLPLNGAAAEITGSTTFTGTEVVRYEDPETWVYVSDSTKNATVVVNTYSDGTYGLELNNVKWPTGRFGNIVLTGIMPITNGDTITLDGRCIFYTIDDAGSDYNGTEFAFGLMESTLTNDSLALRIQMQSTVDNWTAFAIYFNTVNEATAIRSLFETLKGEGAEIYNANGMRLGRMQRGINIIRTKDGRTVKVVKK